MIEHLRGTLLTREPGHVVVECAGVGYGVEIPHSTYTSLPAQGEEVQLFIHFQMREDEISLKGFATERERRLFRILVSVQSVGPKMALGILSTLTADELVAAVASGDIRLLTSIPGVGKRTAERLVVELKEKLRKLEAPTGRVKTEIGADDLEAGFAPGVTRDMRDAAVSALIELGSKPAIAARAVTRAARGLSEEPSVEALVKEGLKLR
jgi:Holliday junction DNA helicase RuvA